ncbi:MAG TPA: amidohydrolase family protein [Chloroflexota bacterium]|nr:amidohydrolase family protein [Chloroflexota bacterium]HZU06706.1 amidohydrolase family protein [Chloroflexota bacterium]
MRIIDLHAYPGTEPWIKSQGPYPEALAKYWHHEWVPKTEEEVIQDFTRAGVEVLLVAFDIETITGSPPCSNDYIAALRDRYPDRIIQGWAAVDPFKGEAALREAERAIRELRLFGFHFHPIMGRFAVNDRRLWPLWEVINALRVPVMIDVGTTGMGAGMPGGHGAILRHAHPAAIDELAANFPDLTIIAAHPGWPWTEEMIAVALHKGNVYWELSGWAPKYFPEPLKRDIRGRLRDKIMFGSDYPSIPYERLFREWAELGYPDEILEKVFHQNAERILGL